MSHPSPPARGPMPAPGPVGRNLIANLERLRQHRGLSLRKLSKRLGDLGRPILPIGLSRLLNAERRVDVDELAALAQVLGVTPAELLAPPDTAADRSASDHRALRAAADLTDRIRQLIEDPADEFRAGQVGRALRRTAIEIEEITGARYGRAANVIALSVRQLEENTGLREARR